MGLGKMCPNSSPVAGGETFMTIWELNVKVLPTGEDLGGAFP